MDRLHVSRLLLVNYSSVKINELLQKHAMQVDSQDHLSQYLEISVFNPLQQRRNFKTLDELKSSTQSEASEFGEEEESQTIQPIKVISAAARFEKNNFEMRAKTLLILRKRIAEQNTAEEVLDTVLSTYGDPALADEALDFLLETTPAKDKKSIEEAKTKLNVNFENQIRSGRNIGLQSRLFAEQLGSPSSLRELYREITGTPREPLALFNELIEKFRYEKMKSVIQFLLHSFGADLKAKGSSISKGELTRLINETRSLQGILGVFRFFQSRMHLIEKQFVSNGLSTPLRFDFELLARVFIAVLAERYVHPDKIFQAGKLLHIDESIIAQILLYAHMRDALRQISPRYFRDARQLDEQWKAYIDAIELLEDQLEEKEDEKKDE